MRFPENKPVKKPSADKFIKINETHKNIVCENEYYKQNIKGSIKGIYVRETVAEKLKKIADQLPEGYSLHIYDAWRPLAVQETFFNDIKEKLKAEGVSPENLIDEAKKFVSIPNTSRFNPAPHQTGGAVDLTLLYHNIPIDMGSEFDTFDETSHTDYYEKHNTNETAKNNRRMLKDIMTKEGFTNLPSEWWHYEYGDGFWADYNNTDAIYTGIFSVEELINEI